MGTLYIVATPIGNLSDISVRAIDILKSVDLIAVEDTRWTIKLLNHYQIKNKMIAYHKFNETKITASLIDKLQSGLNIALVSDAGTPCISDPGYILVNESRNNNIPVIGIPGASALTTSLSVSGIDTSEFTFYGFLPTDSGKLKKLLSRVQKSNTKTHVFYESPKRLVSTVKIFRDYFKGSIISICSDLTKVHERNFFGDINDVYEVISHDANISKGEYVIVLRTQEIKEESINISNEALILDAIIKNNCSIKEGISIVLANNKEIKKNDLYQASLNIKNMLKDKRD